MHASATGPSSHPPGPTGAIGRCVTDEAGGLPPTTRAPGGRTLRERRNRGADAARTCSRPRACLDPTVPSSRRRSAGRSTAGEADSSRRCCGCCLQPRALPGQEQRALVRGLAYTVLTSRVLWLVGAVSRVRTMTWMYAYLDRIQ
jgi:hypothetical protein